MSVYDNLIRLYNRLRAEGKPVCPLAHTYISVHICVLIDPDGKFLASMRPEVRGQFVAVPCTIESDGRTSNVAPHLLSDQIQYVAELDQHSEKHGMYMRQLGEYVAANPNDRYASAVYQYAGKNTLMQDIRNVLESDIPVSIHKQNVIFAVYGTDGEGPDLEWERYYTSVLPKNGICAITGEEDHIPETYPNKIIGIADNSRLFLTKPRRLDGMPQLRPGYVASQKIIQALRYMIYAQGNYERQDAEYHIRGYLTGDISARELKKWAAECYPGKWGKLMEILETESE